jgi:undecaprenyl-diphosphatase
VYILILAVVQGLAELLPVSSSAHIVVGEKLLGLDPSSPPMTLLLVMLHTGTMFAIIVYFWRHWRVTYFQNIAAFKKFAGFVVLATALTGLIGGAIIKIIQGTFFRGLPHAEIEDLFGHLELIAPALALAGILILVAGIVEKRKSTESLSRTNDLNAREAGNYRSRARTLFAFSWILAVWCHDLCRDAPWRGGEVTRRNVQFCVGCCSDSNRGGA